MSDTAEKLQYFLNKKGVSLQDLYLLNPSLKLIVEFLILELDELNAKVETKEEDNNDYWLGY